MLSVKHAKSSRHLPLFRSTGSGQSSGTRRWIFSACAVCGWWRAMAPVVRGTAPISGGSVSKFDTAKRLQDRRGAPDSGSRSHDHRDTTEAPCVEGGWVHQREKCDPLGPGVFREKEELHRTKLLGARGYFGSTRGRDEELIRNYIRYQEREDERFDQLGLWR